MKKVTVIILTTILLILVSYYLYIKYVFTLEDLQGFSALWDKIFKPYTGANT